MSQPVVITAELTPENAQALAQFVKRISHEAIRACSRDDAETFLVRDSARFGCAGPWILRNHPDPPRRLAFACARRRRPAHVVVPHTAAQFGRAIIMPNLRPPVTTAAQALAYKARIQAAVPEGVQFEPLMTLYLTDNLPPDEIRRAKDAGVVAVKLYPAGATTNSDAGVTDLRKTYPTLEAMQREGLLLLVHGEVTSPEIDLFDREAVFIDTQLIPLRRDFPELKIVFEHITTREAAQYVAESDRFTAASLTAHHLLYNRNAIFTGGIRPHYYCLPVLKRETHRQALVKAATSGSPKFFLGTDSAPHAAHLKEHASGCAGCYTAHAAMELYAAGF
jgi:dihydroorotase